MKFGYGQSSEEAIPICDGPNWGAHPASYEVHKVVKGITSPKATYSPDPEYSDEARREKYMSLIYVGGTVDPEGGFTDLCVTQAAGDGLDQKALDEVRTWKFEPRERWMVNRLRCAFWSTSRFTGIDVLFPSANLPS
jgi:TonB family protein